ncbi:MAG: transglycosylase SLT domain-containing protein [Bacteroidales bacterium]|nr:transglycosylase SLT domain-containing protein [Bacteroidales bacterium]
MKKLVLIPLSVLAVIAATLLLNSATLDNGTVASNCNYTYENGNTTPHQSYLPQLPSELYFCGEELPIDRDDVRESIDREIMTNTFWHNNTMLMYKRIGRYFPIIEPILKQYNVPNDIKYLCVAESSLSPTIKSPAGAVGLWQFIESTGKEMGLEINDEVDERYNIERSTRAACKFLLHAYEKLGSWQLVAASYNGGMTRVLKNMQNQRQNKYYDILWSEETSRYVYRIIALKLILENPQQYGFNLTDADRYKPYEVDTCYVDSIIDDWVDFCEAKGITYKQLKTLNPWLRQTYLHPKQGKPYKVLLPKKN